MKNRQISVIMIASIIILLTISTVFFNPDVLEAYAGITLSNDNVAKTIQVRVTPSGTLDERTYDSFSRVGFVSGEGNFLLESVPSKDKRPFYELVKKSIEDKNKATSITRMHVSIDVYAGDGEIIHSLEYRDCSIDEYFIHGIDSKGKIFFLEEDGTVEIREVTKFSCISFTLNIDPPKKTEIISDALKRLEVAQKELEGLDIKMTFEYGGESFFSESPDTPEEGTLFYNSMTNTLQQYKNGTWVDISGVGGPPSPRR
ncbi:MAG: hypothetical protein IIC67_07160 [Thaumarchaeota archaeon]|nr:hypothetical protein [Nitrososphaerota archaeon]